MTEFPTVPAGGVLHHADGTVEVPASLYEDIFDSGQVGDWWWGREPVEEDDGAYRRILWLIVPLSPDSPRSGPLSERGGELLRLYVKHDEKNWAQPGPVNGWDGNADEPTFSPSISVTGGWHGFFERGKLRSV